MGTAITTNRYFLRIAPFIALIASILAVTQRCQGQISLDGDFDHGSLQSWRFEGDDLIRLVGRDNYYGGAQWRWLYFRADNVANEQPTFRISANFAGGANRLGNHKMVYSYDNENWHFFDDNRVTPANRYEFSNETPFSDDTVYIAYAFPYSYGRSVEHTNSVLASPWAAPTDSADANGVIGQSPGGIDDLGRTVEPRDLFGYRITNPKTDAPDATKRKVFIASGLHANETLGTHTFEGLVNWLISDDPRAANLRDVAEFYAYPVLNPDGRFAGNNRSTVENVNRDPNHFWDRSLWQPHQDIRVSGEAMFADAQSTASKTDVFIDFHSTIPAFPNDDFGFIEYEQGDHQSDFWVELKRLQPNIRDVDSTSTTWTTANFAEVYLRTEVDVTFETQFGFDRPLEYYHDMGKNFGLAFHNIWAKLDCDFSEDGNCDVQDINALITSISTGSSDSEFDLNGDGLVTLADRDAWLAAAATANGFATPYLVGDAGLDGSVNVSDLGALGNNWQQSNRLTWQDGDFNGDGIVDAKDLNHIAMNWQRSVAAAATVPEPRSLSVFLLAAFLFLQRPRSR